MENATSKIVEAVAERADVDPAELDPVYEVVEPEALDQVLRSDTMIVTFEYAGYVVTAHNNGEIEIRPIDDDILTS